MAVAFCLIALGCLSGWAGIGSQSARWLTTGTRMKRFNQAMAILLLVAAWSTVLI